MAHGVCVACARREAKAREDAKRAKELAELDKVAEELQRLDEARLARLAAVEREREEGIARRRAAAQEKAEARRAQLGECGHLVAIR